MKNEIIPESVIVDGIKLPKRKVWMKTFGCQMNYHDSERILTNLQELNYFETANREDADLMIFNSCAIRDLANLKFYSQLGEIKKIKEAKKNLIVGIGGCVSQLEGEQLLKKYPYLDFAFGTDAIEFVNKMVLQIIRGEKSIYLNDWDLSDQYSLETKITSHTPRAFVNIMKGCNNYCSYCIVPYTRGREVSRRRDEIVDDVKRLVEEKGIQEIHLLGQNVNSFGKDNNENLAELLHQLDLINGLELIRYTTSHPKDMSDELIFCHRDIKKLANHLHLPVQSGSDTVLQRMERNHTVEHYLNLLTKIRDANPNIALTSDIIVGFPSETEEEFLDTFKLLDLAQYDSIFSYRFSARPGTKASALPDNLKDTVRKRRLKILQDHQLEIQKKIRLKLIDKEFKILVDGYGTKDNILRWRGRTSCNRIVHFTPLATSASSISSMPGENSTNYLWKWVNVKIIKATALSLTAIEI